MRTCPPERTTPMVRSSRDRRCCRRDRVVSPHLPLLPSVPVAPPVARLASRARAATGASWCSSSSSQQCSVCCCAACSFSRTSRTSRTSRRTCSCGEDRASLRRPSLRASRLPFLHAYSTNEPRCPSCPCYQTSSRTSGSVWPWRILLTIGGGFAGHDSNNQAQP